MKRSSKELKAAAREALFGSYGRFAVAFLIFTVITSIAESIPALVSGTSSTAGLVLYLVVSLILNLLLSVLASGFIKMSLNASRGEPVAVGDLFFAFQHHPDRIIIVAFLLTIIILAFQLPTILLIALLSFGILKLSTILSVVLVAAFFIILLIAGVIVMLNYSLSVILLIDEPETGALQSLNVSAQMMKGNRGRLFFLIISFIGILLLCLLSLGIGFFWAIPYMCITFAEFYRDLNGETAQSFQKAEYSGDSYSSYE